MTLSREVLGFSVLGARVLDAAASPGVALSLRVTSPLPIASALVRCEVRIEPARRSYTSAEQERLFDLFGEPPRWARTVRPLTWAQPTVLVPRFVDATTVEVPLPCDLDFDGGVAKYFEGLDAGEVPLTLLFSGTVFTERPDGALQVAQIPWTTETRGALPLALYREAYELFHPGRAMLGVPRDVLELLRRYKVGRGAATWAEALRALLEERAP